LGPSVFSHDTKQKKTTEMGKWKLVGYFVNKKDSDANARKILRIFFQKNEGIHTVTSLILSCFLAILCLEAFHYYSILLDLVSEFIG
jgi:hypothetical protein